MKLLLIIAIMWLSGCVNSTDINAQSKLMQPSDLHTSTKQIDRVTWPQESWWIKFNDPQLNTLVQQAIADSPNLKVAEARLRAKQQTADQAASNLYPNVNATGSIVPQRLSQTSIYPAGFMPSNLTMTDLTLNFQYDFDWWGKNRESLAAALSDAQATAADRASTELILTTGVTQAYLQVVANKKRMIIAQEILQIQKQFLALLKLRQQQGVASDLDIQQAIANTDLAKINLEKLRQNYELSHHQLTALLGKTPEETIAVRNSFPTYSFILPKVLPANLLARRPDVMASRLRAESAMHNIKVAKAQFFPDINLAAAAGYETITFAKLINPQSFAWSAGPAINLPIFNARALRANLGTQYANYDVAVEQYNQQVVTAMQQTADQVSILRSVEQQQRIQRNNLQAIQKNYELIRLRYQNGLDDMLSMLQAKNELLMQCDLQIQMQLQHALATVDVIKAIGGGY